MKKIVTMLVIFLAALVLVGCGGNKEKEEITLVVPQGHPFIAVGTLLNEENVKVDSVNGAPGVKAALGEGKYDVAIAPLNLGAQLYNGNQSKYILDSVITFGNTYIISKENVKLDSLEDLQGKTILAYSKNGTPDIILQYVLNKHNIEVTIEYQQSLAEVAPLFVQNKYDYILAAEPVITNLKVNKTLSLNILDLQDYVDDTIMQAAIFVNPESKNVKLINEVIEKIHANIDEMNANPEAYANSIVNNDVYFSDLGVDIIAQSTPNANLGFLKAKENKAKIEAYLIMIGYKLPNESFYR